MGLLLCGCVCGIKRCDVYYDGIFDAVYDIMLCGRYLGGVVRG
jgi:hypothetical protein